MRSQLRFGAGRIALVSFGARPLFQLAAARVWLESGQLIGGGGGGGLLSSLVSASWPWKPERNKRRQISSFNLLHSSLLILSSGSGAAAAARQLICQASGRLVQRGLVGGLAAAPYGRPARRRQSAWRRVARCVRAAAARGHEALTHLIERYTSPEWSMRRNTFGVVASWK